MVLSDKSIRALCQAKTALISPFSEDKLQGASYDIAIGRNLHKLNTDFKVLDLSQDNLDQIYSKVDLGVAGYMLSPGEYVLITLVEKITMPNNLIAHIRPRTRFTRLGLLISDQHINPTYSGVLQLGVLNATPYVVRLVAGMVLGQLVFEELDSSPTESKLYANKKGAAYHNEDGTKGAVLDDELKTMYANLTSSVRIVRKDG